MFLSVFIILSAVHLYYSYVDDVKGRAATKPYLLLSLAAFYFSASSVRNPYLLIALGLSWLGDVLLIKKGNRWFIAGGISFLIAHVFFIMVFAFSIDWHEVNFIILIPVAAIYLYIAFRIIKSIISYMPKMMALSMYLYLFFNSAMNTAALVRLMLNPGLSGVLPFAGAVLFFISDCVLFLVRYHPDKDLIYRRHFSIMLTYLAAELLITLGILAGEI